MFYGTQVWDPVLITAQIVTMQLLFYMSYGLLLWILVGKPRLVGKFSSSSCNSVISGQQALILRSVRRSLCSAPVACALLCFQLDALWQLCGLDGTAGQRLQCPCCFSVPHVCGKPLCSL